MGAVLRSTEQYSCHHTKPGLNLISLGLRSQTGGPRKGRVDRVASLGPSQSHPSEKVVKPKVPQLSLQLATRDSKIGILTGELSARSLEAKERASPSPLPPECRSGGVFPLPLSCPGVPFTLRGSIQMRGQQEVLR